MQFAGFTEADFDAYLPARAGSNQFNRPRVEVKQKAMSVARGLHEAATAAGLALELRGSDEVPSLWNKRQVTAQWVFLWRDETQRRALESLLDKGRTLAATLTDPTPYFRHAFLALYLDASTVEVALKVHGDAWVDVKNLRARCDDGDRCAELLAAMHVLPEGFSVGVTGHASVSARDVDGSSLSQTFEALTEASQWWFIGRSMTRAEAVAMGPSLGDWIAETFRALLPVYKLAAWSHDNDLVSIERDVAVARAERQHNIEAEAAREAEWRQQHDAEIERRRELAEAETRERVAASERPRPAMVHAAVQHITSRPEPVRSQPAPKPKPSAPPPRVIESKPPKPVAEGALPVAVGAKVKVKNGPFAERIGTVAEVDSKGHARVLFGLIAARLDASELVTVGS